MGIRATILVVAIVAGFGLHASVPPLRVSDSVTGGVQQYVVRRGDTLRTIGARFGVDSHVIAAANDLDPGQALAAGRILTIDNRHVLPAGHDGTQLVINIPQRMLFRSDDAAGSSAFPVAVGRPDWPTPIGPFHVVAREEHPTWDVPVSIQEEMRRVGERVITRMPAGPRNPLGDYWIGLNVGSIGIHGTPYPATIYQFATHGCVRLHPDDIAMLYADVPLDARGLIVYEPVLLARTTEGVFLEVHGDPYHRGRATLDDVKRAAAATEMTTHIDWRTAAEVFRRHEGVARRID
jgi:L,D-transpeptidase ErfK/SrfK